MGLPYTYERVQEDSEKYHKVAKDGKGLAWWEGYLRDEGFTAFYCKFAGLYALPLYKGDVVGILGMDIPHLKTGHVVAVNEVGAVDPADNAPDHVGLQEYVRNRVLDGVCFHIEWLAVTKEQDRVSALRTPGESI